MQDPHTPRCPACGADKAFWKEARTNTGGDAVISRPLRLFSKAHSWIGSEATAAVCTNCGYVMLYVDPLDFR